MSSFIQVSYPPNASHLRCLYVHYDDLHLLEDDFTRGANIIKSFIRHLQVNMTINQEKILRNHADTLFNTVGNPDMAQPFLILRLVRNCLIELDISPSSIALFNDMCLSKTKLADVFCPLFMYVPVGKLESYENTVNPIFSLFQIDTSSLLNENLENKTTYLPNPQMNQISQYNLSHFFPSPSANSLYNNNNANTVQHHYNNNYYLHNFPGQKNHETLNSAVNISDVSNSTFHPDNSSHLKLITYDLTSNLKQTPKPEVQDFNLDIESSVLKEKTSEKDVLIQNGGNDIGSSTNSVDVPITGTGITDTANDLHQPTSEGISSVVTDTSTSKTTTSDTCPTGLIESSTSITNTSDCQDIIQNDILNSSNPDVMTSPVETNPSGSVTDNIDSSSVPLSNSENSAITGNLKHPSNSSDMHRNYQSYSFSSGLDTNFSSSSSTLQTNGNLFSISNPSSLLTNSDFMSSSDSSAKHFPYLFTAFPPQNPVDNNNDINPSKIKTQIPNSNDSTINPLFKTGYSMAHPANSAPFYNNYHHTNNQKDITGSYPLSNLNDHATDKSKYNNIPISHFNEYSFLTESFLSNDSEYSRSLASLHGNTSLLSTPLNYPLNNSGKFHFDPQSNEKNMYNTNNHKKSSSNHSSQSNNNNEVEDKAKLSYILNSGRALTSSERDNLSNSMKIDILHYVHILTHHGRRPRIMAYLQKKHWLWKGVTRDIDRFFSHKRCGNCPNLNNSGNNNSDTSNSTQMTTSSASNNSEINHGNKLN